jgi:CRISPR-associated endonuclease/helicase Cas3
MTFSTAELWAKSPARDGGNETDGYPLLQHLLDVAAVASSLLDTVPCPVPLPCTEAWIVALVGLHDLGKASPGFQIKLGRSHLEDYRLETDQPDRHDIGTAVLLQNGLKALELQPRSASFLAHAVAAHHGHPFTSDEIGRWEWDPSPAWVKAHRDLIQEVIKGTNATGLPALPGDPVDRSAFLQWLMGLTTTADWIGSSEALCRLGRLGQWRGDPRLWFEQAQELAAEAIHQVGLVPSPLPMPPNGQTAVQWALGTERQPRPLQNAVADVLDSLADQSALIVIEAPMGEGKTEAALSCTFGTRGFYTAMPTQATSNALFERVAGFLEGSQGPGSRYRIALAHGGGGPEAAALKLRDIGLGTEDSPVRAGWWFRGSKRALLCPHGIGTVDQGLIGVLQSRHGFLRLYGLAGRTVIFDEVHAYDTYTGGLIERLIVWLQALRCRVVVMSATLPASRREALLRAWAGGEGAPTLPTASTATPHQVAYPRVSWTTNGAAQTISFAASRPQRVLVRSCPADELSIAGLAATWSQMGARVLVVVNKVKRAQALFQLLTTTTPSTLFHARFPMEQRLEIESKVLSSFGPVGTASQGHVLVATQVAEQSLDIDFDVLITDPAPVDLVLQRQGRIHRHPRERPQGFEQPVVHVVDLDEPLPSEELCSYVYDRWDVLRSIAWLRDHRELELPEDIDRAVQEVYGDWQPTGPRALLEALAEANVRHEADLQAMRSQAMQAALDAPEEWRIGLSGNCPVDDEAAESGALRFGTRLGQDSESVIPLSPSDLEDLGAGAERLRNRYLRISHPQLLQAVRAAPTPTGWRTLPGLAHHLPLRLDEEGRVLGTGLASRLDPVLGLVLGELG